MPKQEEVLSTDCFGSITVIREELPQFEPEQLAVLLGDSALRALRLPNNDGSRPIGLIPNSQPPLVLRWNESGITIPSQHNKTLQHARIHNRHMRRLEGFGLATQPRNIYVVERDPHNEQLPTIYIVAPFREGLPVGPIDPAVIDPRVLERNASSIAQYLKTVPDGQPLVQDLGVGQCDPDGVLLDNDQWFGLTDPCRRSLITDALSFLSTLSEALPTNRDLMGQLAITPCVCKNPCTNL